MDIFQWQLGMFLNLYKQHSHRVVVEEGKEVQSIWERPDTKLQAQ